MKIAVGMSGGIDSSAALIRLYEKQHELIGITLKTTSNSQDYGKCCSLQDIYDAKKLCRKLGVRHYLIDAKQDFHNHIIQSFIDDYFEGKTPNPCVHCNSLIKFPYLIEIAESLGYEKVATGHYAILEHDTKPKLKCAVDLHKDQSYFLSRLSHEILSKSLFPLGHTLKSENVQLLRNHSISICDKKESHSLCFVPGDDYTSFLRDLRGDYEGDILNEAGQVLGKHKGVAYYTIGQRKGLGIAAEKPLYVRKLNPLSNTIEIGDKPYQDTCSIQKVNWLGSYNFTDAQKIKVKVRYLHEGEDAILRKHAEDIQIQFDRPVFSISKGQAAVGYVGDEVIFSGIIV